MNIPTNLLVAVSLQVVASVLSADLPAGITACHRSDPMIGRCLKTAIEQALVVFKNGYEEFNIRRLEPLLIPDLNLIQSKSSENFHLSLAFRDLYIKRITEAQFDQFKVDMKEDGSIEMKSSMHFPHMIFDGKYELAGKLLLFTLDASDNAHMHFTNLRGNISLELQPEDVDGTGTLYLVVQDAKFTASAPEKFKVSYDNLVKGNAQLSADMNRILEESMPSLQEIFQPSIDSFLTNLFSKAATKVFSVVPMDVAMPP